MIQTKFNAWVDNVKNELEEIFITTEYINHKSDESRISDNSTSIVNESEYCLGRVTVWESRQMEYEVVNIITKEMILREYIEKLSYEPNFHEILEKYFHVLQTGLKP